MTKIVYKNTTKIQDTELGEVDMNNEKELEAKIAEATAHKNVQKKPNK